MQTGYTISKELQQDLWHFLNNYDIALLNQNLRRLLVDFLDYELRTGVPLYFNGFFYPFNKLLDLLDIAAQELQIHTAAKKLKEHPAKYKAMPLDKVITFVKASLNPVAIFLLHHKINKNKQDLFDLLVIVPATSNTRFSYYEQVLTMANMDNVMINASLHKEEMLQQQLSEGHIYYSIVCNRQNLVYSGNAFGYPDNGKEIFAKLADKAITVFNAAFTNADSFLRGAANFFKNRNNCLGAFMLQQAAELLIRGLVTALSGTCIKTHSFNELKKPLARYLPALEYIISENEKEEERLLQLLEKAYIESRYSGSFYVTDEDINFLNEAVKLLHERAVSLFNQRISTLTIQENIS